MDGLDDVRIEGPDAFLLLFAFLASQRAHRRNVEVHNLSGQVNATTILVSIVFPSAVYVVRVHWKRTSVFIPDILPRLRCRYVPFRSVRWEKLGCILKIPKWEKLALSRPFMKRILKYFFKAPRSATSPSFLYACYVVSWVGYYCIRISDVDSAANIRHGLCPIKGVSIKWWFASCLLTPLAVVEIIFFYWKLAKGEKKKNREGGNVWPLTLCLSYTSKHYCCRKFKTPRSTVKKNIRTGSDGYWLHTFLPCSIETPAWRTHQHRWHSQINYYRKIYYL